MNVRIVELLWDDETVEHLARHQVIPEEVDAVCRFQPYALRTRGSRYLVLGQSHEGRYLTIIMTPLGSGRWKVITARGMTEPERRRYLRR